MLVSGALRLPSAWLSAFRKALGGVRGSTKTPDVLVFDPKELVEHGLDPGSLLLQLLMGVLEPKQGLGRRRSRMEGPLCYMP